MAHSALVFALSTEHFSAYPEIPPPVADAVLVTPVLRFYCTAAIAAEQEEGLSFVEGEVAFFAADGSLLIPKFSREPYINKHKNTYFPGVYTLQPASGNGLADEIKARMAQTQFKDDIHILVILPEDDEEAKLHGWKNAALMEAAINEALAIFPKDLKKRIIFEILPRND